MQLYGSHGIPSRGLQHLFSSTLHRDLLSSLKSHLTKSPADLAVFTSLIADRGNRILNYDLHQTEFRVHDTVFLDSIRHMLRLPPSPLLRNFPNAQCVCGFLLSNDQSHFYSCVHISKASRHKEVMDRLVKMAKSCGVVVVELEHNLATGERTDATFQFPQLAKHIQVDACIVHAAADSYINTGSTRPLQAAYAKDHEKQKKYRALVEKEGDVFFPMVWESTGASTQTVKRLLQLFVETADKSMQSDPPSLKYMLDFINYGIQVGNTELTQRGLKLMKRHLPKTNQRNTIEGPDA